MPIYKSRGRQDERQGQRVTAISRHHGYARDQYGHRLFSVQGRGNHPMIGLHGERVYADGVERFKGTAKACIEYCRSHRGYYVIVTLVRA